MKKNSNKGFSLIELIVVIAIMAIIAAVAIPVYSSYLESANKGVDEALAADVKHIVELALIAGTPEGFEGGVAIVINKDGTQVRKLTAGSAADVAEGENDDVIFIENVLEKAYGKEWSTVLKTKYSKWESGSVTAISEQFKESSFKDKQQDLLNEIQGLSSVISAQAGVGNGVFGDGYGKFLDDNGIDKSNPDALGNAAALYVADTTNALTEDERVEIAEKFANLLVDSFSVGADVAFGDLVTMIRGKMKSTAVAAATIYAFAEGFSQYMESKGCKTIDGESYPDILHASKDGITNSSDALTQIMGAFATIQNQVFDTGRTPSQVGIGNSYFGEGGEGSQAYKDAMAYFSALDAISDSRKSLLEKIDEKECFTDGALLSKFDTYISLGELEIEDGTIAVVINADPTKGGFSVISYPMDF